MANKYEILSKYYDEFWGSSSAYYLDFIEQLLVESGMGTARILDMACKNGDLVKVLAEHDHIVYGVDESPEMIDLAKENTKNLENARFKVQKLIDINLKGKFALII